MFNIGASESIFILGLCILLLAPTVITFILVSIRSRQKKQISTERRIRCPYCAEWIQPEAKVCRFCKREIKIVDI